MRGYQNVPMNNWNNVTISGFSSDTLKGKVVGIKKQTHVKNKVVIYDMEQSDKNQLL